MILGLGVIADVVEMSLDGVTDPNTELPLPLNALPPPKVFPPPKAPPAPKTDLTGCPPLAQAGFESPPAPLSAAANPVGPPCANAPNAPDVVPVVPLAGAAGALPKLVFPNAGACPNPDCPNAGAAVLVPSNPLFPKAGEGASAVAAG